MTDRNETDRMRSRRIARRSLMKGAASIAAASAGGGLTHGFAQDASPVASDPAMPPPSPSVAELQQQLASGDVTVGQVVQAALDRIEALDQAGPAINAVIELNPDALDIAAELDAELAAGTMRSPMHGIPVLIKDNIATGDQMETTGLTAIQPFDRYGIIVTYA